MDLFFKKEFNEKNLPKILDDFRKKNIPKQYNQIALVDNLFNPNIDHYISISNRADGKTFNYTHFFLKFALETGIQLLFLSRDFMLRKSYQDLVLDIIDKSPYFNPNDIRIINTQFFREVFYKEQTLCFISDLNAATDLKYFSSRLKNVGIIIYDEFLALESDYLIDEWERLKTIYSSVNRNFKLPLLKYPKVFYLGNAVNLSSPILSHLDIFTKLETQPINSMRIYDNICIELRKNTFVNTKRNTRAFNEDIDPLTQGQFDINKFNIALESDLRQKYNIIIVKLKDNFLKVQYDSTLSKIILTIVGYSKYYDYNMLAKDNNDTSVYLTDRYYSEKSFKKHLNNLYLYGNGYSKDVILSDYSNIKSLDIIKLIKEFSQTKKKSAVSSNLQEKDIKDTYIELSKKSILSKLL